jgi:hypothetical protein
MAHLPQRHLQHVELKRQQLWILEVTLLHALPLTASSGRPSIREACKPRPTQRTFAHVFSCSIGWEMLIDDAMQ